MSFNPASSNFSTGPFVPEDGDYTLKIIGYSVGKRNTKEGEKTVLDFRFRIIGGEYDGKRPQPLTVWEADDAGEGTGAMMRVVLAACGIVPGTPDADTQFREQFGDLDLSFDAEEKTFGSAWDTHVKNAEISATLRKKLSGDRIYQNYNNIQPA